jgi:hypothetical protein
MSWGRQDRFSRPKPRVGFQMENKIGYQENIRNFLSESEFVMSPNDLNFFGIAGLSAPSPNARNKMPTLRTTKSEPGYVPKKRHGGPES